jgi:hypothetical protein
LTAGHKKKRRSSARENGAYRRRVRTAFAALKKIARFDELVSRSIALPQGRGYLACVCELHTDDGQTIERLAKWREHATTFHSKFKVTFEGTRSWLRSLLLDVPDRILFLVLNRHGSSVGHLGFANALNDASLIELDNVVRGVPAAEPGIMSVSTLALMNWARQHVKPAGFYLRTLESNTHAIAFYSRLGFKTESKEPLRRIEAVDGYNHVPIEHGDERPADDYFVRMRFVARMVRR